MSTLGEAIYHVLTQRLGLVNPLISYQELVTSLPSLDPPYEDITRNDERLFRALGEVGRACRERGLPSPTALVIRSMERSPGAGYYHMFHPETGDDPVKQREAWERELERVKSTKYPQSLVHGSTDRSDTHSDERPRSRPLGHFRVADNASRAAIVFTGQIMCPRCSASLDVEIERNASAVSARQPAFVVVEAGASPGGKPIGHLFIGTILSSPVLYYGSLNHCGTEQRIAVFYNRALRDRSDHHLTVMPSTSAQPNTPYGEDEDFKLL
jgi:hypothetical protein